MSRRTREMLLLASFALAAAAICRAQDPFGDSGNSTFKDATRGKTVEESIALLKKMVADESCEEGGEAAFKLLEICAADAESLFNESQLGLTSPDASRRRDAAVSLGRLCGAADLRMREPEVLRRSVAAMASALEDLDPGVRAAAARGLAEAFDGATLDTVPMEQRLRIALQDGHSPVRAAIARTIGAGGVVDLLPDVVPLFQDSDDEVRREAARCAGKLADRIQVPDPRWIAEAEARADTQVVSRLNRQLKLVETCYPIAVAGLCQLATDSVVDVREAAVEALGKNWGASVATAEKALEAAADDEDALVRAVAVTSISCMGRRAAPHLLDALKDDDDYVVYHAIESLGTVFQGAGPVRFHVGRGARYHVDSDAVAPGRLDDFDRYYHFRSPSDKETNAVDELAQGIANTLAQILSDPTSTNRVAAGDALDKMGPNARHTAARVANSLVDEDKQVRSKALDVLQSIGPAAKQQIPAIERVIREYPTDVYEAAGALDEIAQDPEDFRAASTALVEALGCSDTDSAQRAAIALARRGDAALEPLLKALGDGNACRRRSAAFAIAHLGERAESAVPRLLALLHDSEPDVVWNSVQALGQIAPDTEEAVAGLVATLNHSDNGVRAKAAEALAAINNDAVRAAAGTMVDIALSSEDALVRSAVLEGLTTVGLNEDTAERLSAAEVPEDSPAGPQIFQVLLHHPNIAVVFLKKHPWLLADCPPATLVEILDGTDPRALGLRAAIRQSHRLPPEVMAWVGDPCYLPVLEQRMAEADPHLRTFLEACARACGARPTRIVEISEDKPGDFCPESAGGMGDRRRMPQRFQGAHGDGAALICVTGRIVVGDSSPAQVPKFFNTNDRMLLGRNFKEPATIKYDPATGRFVFFTHVFAAFAPGGEEAGPYQTGAARVLIEVENAKPLEVSFFDEMPEVLIRLTWLE